MIKIGITGSIASGKTTASKILSYKRGPLFSADYEIKKIYKKNNFKKTLVKKFNIKKKANLKRLLKKKIFENSNNLKKLEKTIHPLVRKEMKKFSLKHKNKKIIFFEIPLLIENKLMKYFDVIIFIKTNKTIRLKRFMSSGGDKNLFNFLNKRQLSDRKKTKFSDHVVNNEKNYSILKKNLLGIIKFYV
jgi:dephospho-CoA kinase